VKRQRPPAARATRGAALIEVLLTTVVLGVGLLGLAALTGVSLQANQTAHFRTQATHLIDEIADHARANRSLVIASAALPGADFWNARTAELLPGGTVAAAIDAARDEITVEIAWNDGRNPVAPPTIFTATTRF